MKLDREELNKISEQHKLWLENGGEKWEKADLNRVFFNEATLNSVEVNKVSLIMDLMLEV